MIKFEVNQQVGKKISASVWRQWLKNIKSTLKIKKNPEISIALIGAGEMKKLNFHYRGINRSTDVLSFSELDGPDKQLVFKKSNYLGEIIICYQQAQKQARAAGHSVNQEIEVLLVHGFLHLLGYDHKNQTQAEEMQQLQRKIYGAF